MRAGGLAEGWDHEGKHGTLYAAVVFSRTLQAGSGMLLASIAAGLAETHGSALSNHDPSLGLTLIARGAYLAPVGPIRLGIGLDVLTVPGLGAALLAAPMLDVPF